MFGFKKNRRTSCDDYMTNTNLRWNRIASHYDSEKHEYVYITEPVLQYQRGICGRWYNVDTNTDIMAPVKAANA